MKTIDYYMALDFGVIFPQSGGLPLPKRAPQRQVWGQDRLDFLDRALAE